METPFSTFVPFTRLPVELRLKIWRLALPARTIEQTWNNPKRQWEFKVVGFESLSKNAARAWCTDWRTLGTLPYRRIDDVRPFYFAEIDTIYVRHHFHEFDTTKLAKWLRSLQMDWGTPPYWWLNPQLQGPAFLRQFPRLEIFTLVMRTPKFTDGDEDIERVETAKGYVTRVMEIERGLYPEWHAPLIQFKWKKNQIDWNITSMSKSLLPENQNETRNLYSWANE